MKKLYTLILLLFVATAVQAGLFPSVNTYQRIPSTQNDLAWMISHYDFIDSAPAPIGNWSPAQTDMYDHWELLNLIGDADYTQQTRPQAQKWYEWCVNNNYDWENGFLHVGTADTTVVQSLGTYGNQTDSIIRWVMKNTSPTNYSDKAWAGTASIPLSAGDSIYFGRLDRFDRIELGFATFAVNFTGVWEYWNGNSWVALGATDATNGCSVNGTVQFTPPTASKWKRTLVNDRPLYWGSSGIYFIRLRCISTSTAPVIKLAQGRHYWVHNGNESNIIPAWNPANDADGDGYAELAPANNCSAKFKYEARMPHFWAWCQFVANLSDANMRAKFISSTVESLNYHKTSVYSYTGAQLDDMNGNCNIPTAVRANTIEYAGLSSSATIDAWRADMVKLLDEGKPVLNTNGYLLGGNVGWDGIDLFNSRLDYLMREDASGSGGSWRYSNTGFWGNWEDYVWNNTCQMQKWLAANKKMLWQWQLTMYYRMGESSKLIDVTNGSTAVTGYNTQWLSSVDKGSILYVSSGGDWFGEVASVNSNTSITLTAPWTGPTKASTGHNIYLARDKYMGLAAFLSLKNTNSFFSMWWGYSYNSNKSKVYNWIPAVELDYGVPTGVVPEGKTTKGLLGAYLYQTGVDPSSTSRSYSIYAREYTKAFVLFRPLVYAGSYFDTSAVTVDLPEPMYKVDYYGNKSALVSSISLRGGEGAIFLKNIIPPVPPILTITKAQSTSEVYTGDTITYTITVKNTGGTGYNVKVTDVLATEFVYVEGSAKKNSMPITPSPVSGQTFLYVINEIPTNTEVVITFDVVVK